MKKIEMNNRTDSEVNKWIYAKFYKANSLKKLLNPLTTPLNEIFLTSTGILYL